MLLHLFIFTLKSIDPSPSWEMNYKREINRFSNLVKYPKELVKELLCRCSRVCFVWIVLVKLTKSKDSDQYEDRNVDNRDDLGHDGMEHLFHLLPVHPPIRTVLHESLQ